MAAAKRKRKKPEGRPTKKLSDEELAPILSHAATFTVTAAAKEFGLSRRTVQRYQAEVREGKRPELAQLIAAESELATARSRSKIQKALDALLDRVIELAPTAKLPDAIQGVEKIGDLATTRKVLGVESDSEDQTAPGNEGLGGRTKGSTEELPPVH